MTRQKLPHATDIGTLQNTGPLKQGAEVARQRQSALRTGMTQKIQTQMTIPCLTRSTLRGHALGNASRTGRTPPTTISFQKVREETPKIKISRVCPGDHKEKEASCCSETTDMPDMPLVTLGCINYRDTGRPSAHGSEAQTHLLQVARHQDEPRRQYARP